MMTGLYCILEINDNFYHLSMYQISTQNTKNIMILSVSIILRVRVLYQLCITTPKYYNNKQNSTNLSTYQIRTTAPHTFIPWQSFLLTTFTHYSWVRTCPTQYIHSCEWAVFRILHKFCISISAFNSSTHFDSKHRRNVWGRDFDSITYAHNDKRNAQV